MKEIVSDKTEYSSGAPAGTALVAHAMSGFDGMVRRDLEYIAKRGVATDLKIVALTVVEMITGGGAC